MKSLNTDFNTHTHINENIYQSRQRRSHSAIYVVAMRFATGSSGGRGGVGKARRGGKLGGGRGFFNPRRPPLAFIPRRPQSRPPRPPYVFANLSGAAVVKYRAVSLGSIAASRSHAIDFPKAVWLVHGRRCSCVCVFTLTSLTRSCAPIVCGRVRLRTDPT